MAFIQKTQKAVRETEQPFVLGDELLNTRKIFIS